MTKQEKYPGRTGLEVAVIGMDARFPGAKTTRQFWENLKNGKESISFFSDEELKSAGIPDELIDNPHYVKANGLLEDTDYFDSAFFGYTPREAEVMHPQIRLFHECAWKAMEDAGYVSRDFAGAIGLYAGASPGFEWEALVMLSGKSRYLDGMATANLINKDSLCTRTAYKLDLKGPVVTLATACSTSLTAIHQAYRALLTGECDMALAGGVSVAVRQKQGYLYQEGMIASPDGHCRAFDRDANGTVSGSGVGVVVLKPLAEAMTDGDHIYAVIKGSAVNNDGTRKVGYMAPSVDGQAEAIKKAQRMARLAPETIAYIEAHGTGTALGDPVEIEALKLAFNTTARNFCGLGSVKSNFGHLDAAAGVAGFIKAVLILMHRFIPPTLNFNSPNPKIDFENSPFYVNTGLKELADRGTPLRVGVSSFGIGGTNAHVVLEEFPAACRPQTSAPHREYQLILLSAKTKAAINRATDKLADYLVENPDQDLADIAYTLQVGRRAFRYRRTLVCSTTAELMKVLADNPADGLPAVFTREKSRRPIVFMFPGQGSQYPGMGQELYRTEPVFRREVDNCLEILAPITGCDLGKVLIGSGPGSPGTRAEDRPDINQTEITQPALFVIEYALAKLLGHWGIKPDAMIGHSLGEYVAACLSGVFSLADALALVALRGRLMQQTDPGAMLSVALSMKKVRPFLDDDLSLAAVNARQRCVVSGPIGRIDDLQQRLKQENIDCRLLHTSHAFHSRLMDPILDEFDRQLRKMAPSAPQIPFMSNVTGQAISAGEAGDPGYWTRHLRNTVQFAPGLETLMKEKDAVFLEVGPGDVLTRLARQQADKKDEQLFLNLLPSARESTPEDRLFLDRLGQIWLHGIPIDWPVYHEEEKRGRLSLPTYPFDRLYYPQEFSLYQAGGPTRTRKLVKESNIADWFYLPSWKRQELPIDRAVAFPSDGHPLLFITGDGLGMRLAGELTRAGQRPVMVKAGDRFQKEAAGVYTIDPGKKEDYETLIADLQAAATVPGHIFHLWNVGETQEPGFYSLLYLAAALEKKGILQKIDIIVVTTHLADVTGGEELQPEKATLLGPVRVIPQEYPHIRCRILDIEPPISPGSDGGNLVFRLVREIDHPLPATMVAFRGHKRWVQGFEPLGLQEVAGPTALLRKNGVYLITGGLGTVGLILADYLVKNFQARLVLLGRSPFPDRGQWPDWVAGHPADDPVSRGIHRLRGWEANGTEPMIIQADVCDYPQMESAFSAAEERFGAIHGVVHAAGITRGESISLIGGLNRESCHRQFRPKVDGLVVLEKVLANRRPDFCLLTSSLAAVLGGLGLAAYAAANSFMDAFALRHNRDHPTPWISVNWDGWQPEDGPLAANPGGAGIDRLGITPAEGGEAFKRILSAAWIGQVVCSTGKLDTRLKQWVFQKPDREEQAGPVGQDLSSLFPRPDISDSYVAPRDPLESTIAGIWQELFGLEKTGIHDDFFELGGDSLVGMRFVNRYREWLGEIVHIRALFDAPTIAELAEYFRKFYPEAVARVSAVHGAGGIEGKPSEAGETPVTSRINAGLIETLRRRLPGLPPFPSNDDRKNPAAVFILCPPRSGSTLLRVILAGHPRLFAPPELNLLGFNSFDEIKRFRHDQPGTYYQGCTRALMQLKGIGVQQAQDLIGEWEDQKMTVKAFYRQIQEWLGDRLLVDKSPNYTFTPAILARLETDFENPLYIHLLRHPGGMIHSFDEAKLDLLSGSQFSRDNPFTRRETAELIWIISQQNILKFLENIPQKRRFRLKFEDLVKEPGRMGQDLCRFLGIDFQSEEMLQPYKEKKNRMTDGIHEQEGMMVGDVKFHDHRQIDADTADNWQKHHRVDLLADITRRLAGDLGYPPDHRSQAEG